LLKFIDYILLTALLAAAVSCNTNPPTEIEDEKEYGLVYVNSNVTGAEIHVDGMYSGFVTPDTLTLEAGSHEIEVTKIGYSTVSKSVMIEANSGTLVEFNIEVLAGKKVVLLEDFANVSCGPCVYANAIIKVLAEDFGTDNLVVIQYPTNFPSPTDPFYLANSSDANSRINFYQIFVAPTVIIDGNEKPIATDAADIKARIEQNLLETPGINIEVTDSLTANQYFSKVYIESISSLQNPEDYDLYVNVTENNISFDTPPGSNGETDFNHVMRKINLIDLASAISGNEITIERSVSINFNWAEENLNTVVFIQNKITKEVIQANTTE
jgi:thiol-disulfide isomerase/thioredoxin